MSSIDPGPAPHHARRRETLIEETGMHKKTLPRRCIAAILTWVAVLQGCADHSGPDARADPGPATGAWTPGPERYGIGKSASQPITMRDGVVLKADVYYPTEPDGSAAPGPFPVLVAGTPYSKETAQALPTLPGYEPYLVKRGYINVVFDVRGSGASGGTFQLFGPDETQDSVEVIHWAARLPHASGKLGMVGESYGGIVQLFAAGAIGPDSPLKAIFPITAANDIYRDFAFSGGILNIESMLAANTLYGAVTPLLLPPLSLLNDPAVPLVLAEHAGALRNITVESLAEVMTDGDRAYDQDWWQARAPARVLESIVRNGIAVYAVDALWDIYQEGAPRNYSGLQNAWAGRAVHAPMSPTQPVSGRYQLLIKHAYHGDTSLVEPNLDPIKLAWFDRWLKDQPTGIELTDTPLHIVLPDDRRIDVARYPLPEALPTVYYLDADSRLSRNAPTAETGADTIVYAGVTLPCDRSFNQWALGGTGFLSDLAGFYDPCADGDNVPQMLGPGQLSYETAPFTEETRLAGPIAARFVATATTPDSAWVLKVSDVGPDGRAVDLTQGALLGSFRELDPERSWYTPEGRPLLVHPPYTRASVQPVVPGELTAYDIGVRPIYATLQPGHRLRLTILTSQTPHLLPTPLQQARLLGGVYRLQRHAAAASYIQFPLAPASAIPSRDPGTAPTME